MRHHGLFFGLGGGHWDQLAVTEIISAAPADAAARETHQPDRERHGIPQGISGIVSKGLAASGRGSHPHVIAVRSTAYEPSQPAQRPAWDARQSRAHHGDPVSKDQAKMAPGPHVAHHHDPAQPFVKQLAECCVIGHSLDSVRAATPPVWPCSAIMRPTSNRRRGRSPDSRIRRIRPDARAWWRWWCPARISPRPVASRPAMPAKKSDIMPMVCSLSVKVLSPVEA